MKRFVLSTDAAEDLTEIKTYLLEQGGTSLARHIFEKLRSAIEMLATHPFSGHTREDLTHEALRFWPVFSYLIVYDPETKPLGIVRILQGNQDLVRLFSRSRLKS
jgi:toxin ParE1/3/4